MSKVRPEVILHIFGDALTPSFSSGSKTILNQILEHCIIHSHKEHENPNLVVITPLKKKQSMLYNHTMEF